MKAYLKRTGQTITTKILQSFANPNALQKSKDLGRSMNDLVAIGPDLNDASYSRAEEVHAKKKARRAGGKPYNKAGSRSSRSSSSGASYASSDISNVSLGTASLGSVDMDSDTNFDDEAPLPKRHHRQGGSDQRGAVVHDDTDASSDNDE